MLSLSPSFSRLQEKRLGIAHVPSVIYLGGLLQCMQEKIYTLPEPGQLRFGGVLPVELHDNK